ncbi:arginase [Aspergillus avenaceus]|uniref:Arginase n=1 Tax=Aspergillus avenaceus TaxID=36643 RepID=A0A5N6U0U6_ASPAV|nr:arginase [Aspergillus avenaceus]
MIHQAHPPKFVKSSHLAVFAAKVSCGAPRDGAQGGPDAVISSGIFHEMQSKSKLTMTFDVHNDENEGYPESDFHGMKRPRAVSNATQHISDLVYDQAREGNFVLTLRGDHSIGIGTVSGVAKAIRERHLGREIGVLWIDAHADINTPETSLSRRIHGMPVAFVSGLVKVRLQGVFDWLEESYLINLQKLVYIGLRDVDDAERDIIAQHNVKAFYIDDVKRDGIQHIMDTALDHLGSETPLHVSYDINSLDPNWAPSTVFPVEPGLTREEGVYVAKRLAGTGQLVAMDLVEINPQIGPSKLGVTVESGCSVIKSALGF